MRSNRDPAQLETALALTPISEDSMSYAEFLCQLPDHPEWEDNAARTMVRAIDAEGIEDITGVDPERRLYLEMLKVNKIESYNAFADACGSQRFVHELYNFWSRAAAGGEELRKAVVVLGPSGCGKDLIKLGALKALESGSSVWTVKGCPVQENPLNLLRLLSRKALTHIADSTGIEFRRLQRLTKRMSDPCSHCTEIIKGTRTNPVAQPNLKDVTVERVRLSRTLGFADWKPSANNERSLEDQLVRGNRGLVSLQDVFLEITPREGETDPRMVLLEVTRYRVSSKGDPLDNVMYLTTNENTMTTFRETKFKDPTALMNRIYVIRMAYNTVRVEEVRAITTELENYEENPHYAPLFEKVLATAIVLSRFGVPPSNDSFVHPLDRIRLLEGEQIKVARRPISAWAPIYQPTPGAPRSSGNSFDEKAIAVAELWREGAERDGQQGFDASFVFGALSTINARGLAAQHKCVMPLEGLKFMKEVIGKRLATKTVPPAEVTVLERVDRWLTTTNPPAERPELVEAEYRRLLKGQFVKAFASDYEAKAKEYFEDYCLHALPSFLKKKTVVDKTKQFSEQEIPVNEGLLDELDRFRLGKGRTDYLSEKDKEFRETIGALLQKAAHDHRQRYGLEVPFEETWQTVPELAQGIRRKIEFDTSALVEKAMSTDVQSGLTETEREKLAVALETMRGFGYCEHCLPQVLDYAKAVKVWAFQNYY